MHVRWCAIIKMIQAIFFAVVVPEIMNIKMVEEEHDERRMNEELANWIEGFNATTGITLFIIKATHSHITFYLSIVCKSERYTNWFAWCRCWFWNMRICVVEPWQLKMLRLQVQNVSISPGLSWSTILFMHSLWCDYNLWKWLSFRYKAMAMWPDACAFLVCSPFKARRNRATSSHISWTLYTVLRCVQHTRTQYAVTVVTKG